MSSLKAGPQKLFSDFGRAHFTADSTAGAESGLILRILRNQQNTGRRTGKSDRRELKNKGAPQVGRADLMAGKVRALPNSVGIRLREKPIPSPPP